MHRHLGNCICLGTPSVLDMHMKADSNNGGVPMTHLPNKSASHTTTGAQAQYMPYD